MNQITIDADAAHAEKKKTKKEAKAAQAEIDAAVKAENELPAKGTRKFELVSLLHPLDLAFFISPMSPL